MGQKLGMPNKVSNVLKILEKSYVLCKIFKLFGYFKNSTNYQFII